MQPSQCNEWTQILPVTVERLCVGDLLAGRCVLRIGDPITVTFWGVDKRCNKTIKDHILQ